MEGVIQVEVLAKIVIAVGLMWDERIKMDKISLDRKDVRARKCWWVPDCKCVRERYSYNIFLQAVHKAGRRTPTTGAPYAPAIVVVSGDEARNGKGRLCQECGSQTGYYVCDGFPTFTGSVVFKE